MGQIDFTNTGQAVAFVVALGVVFLVSRRRGDRSPLSYFWTFLFVIYVFNVARLTLFPIFPGGDSTAGHIVRAVNLVPSNSNMMHDQVVGNVLLCVPFGAYWRGVAGIRGWRGALIAVLCILGIELCQLMISLMTGNAYRTVDISDFLLNAIGGGVGWLIGLGVTQLPGGARVHLGMSTT